MAEPTYKSETAEAERFADLIHTVPAAVHSRVNQRVDFFCCLP